MLRLEVTPGRMGGHHRIRAIRRPIPPDPARPRCAPARRCTPTAAPRNPTLSGLPARLATARQRPTWPWGRPPTPRSGDRPVATHPLRSGPTWSGGVAWSLQLLDAHAPGRLGRALDGRTTTLDHASRQPGPRCPPDPANPVAAHPAAAPMAAAVVAGLAGHGHGPAPPPRSPGGALHEPTTPPGPWPERAGPAGRGGHGRPPPDRSSWSSGSIAPRCTPLGGPLSRHAPPTRTTGSRRTDADRDGIGCDRLG